MKSMEDIGSYAEDRVRSFEAAHNLPKDTIQINSYVSEEELTSGEVGEVEIFQFVMEVEGERFAQEVVLEDDEYKRKRDAIDMVVGNIGERLWDKLVVPKVS